MTIRLARLASPFKAILATGYYDGPTDGYAVGIDDDVFGFRTIGSDDDVRVFLVSRIAAVPAAELVARGEWVIGEARLLPVEGPAALERVLADCGDSATEHAVLASPDLLSEVLGWWPITEAVRADARWIAALAAEVVVLAVTARRAGARDPEVGGGESCQS